MTILHVTHDRRTRLYTLALRTSLICLNCNLPVAVSPGEPLCDCDDPDTLTEAELPLSSMFTGYEPGWWMSGGVLR